MARLVQPVDVSQEKGGAAKLPPIPAGVYMAQITAAEEKQTQDYSGYYLHITFSIVGGQYAGRLVWGNITTASSSPEKMATGRRHMANLLDGCGLPRRINDSDILLQKVLPIKVRIQKGNEQYPDDTNSISEYGLGADKDYRPQQTASYAAPQPSAYPPQQADAEIVDYGINGDGASAAGLRKPPVSF